MDPTTVLQEYGPTWFPVAVFICAAFENDVTFVMAGVYCATLRHHMAVGASKDLTINLHTIFLGVIAGVIGALCHDSFWFAIGHHRSRWIKTTRAWRTVGPQIEQWAARFGPWELFLCRFIPGTRNASQLFWGVQRLALWKFYLIDGVALAIWGTMLTFFGYKFSLQAESWIRNIGRKHVGKHLIVLLLLTSLIYVVVRAVTKHEIVKHGKPPDDPRAD